MADISESLQGIVQRVTYHNPDTGWSVLRVAPFGAPGELVTVTVHQTQVHAGATMLFAGAWSDHPRFGRQFRAEKALEKKPATAAALEKYLGSGLISGVGPRTAGRIVRHFGDQTLPVFEENIDRLLEVPGIADKKLAAIAAAWREHRMVREVMMFLQGHGISTLFAVRIYKKYGERAIEMVRADPYRLAEDFYGIGFFSADRVAQSLGLAADSDARLGAAVRHLLAAAREQGHCYLTAAQLASQADELLGLSTAARLGELLTTMAAENRLKVRLLGAGQLAGQLGYYSRTLYEEESLVAAAIRAMAARSRFSLSGLGPRIAALCRQQRLRLSAEQSEAVAAAVCCPISVLTGGPGCGKTTTTEIIVRLLEQLGRRVLLAAPTGRAAQRLGEVIGREAKTLHRLLEWQNGGFQKNHAQPLRGDFLIVDESSMLDISLAAALLRAVPAGCQLLLLGDADQLPSVGPGNVLRDIIASGAVPVFRLTQIFRQAELSRIIANAHRINRGEMPVIDSPFHRPQLWREKVDCLFIDSDEATQEQLGFISRVKRLHRPVAPGVEEAAAADPFLFGTAEASPPWRPELVVPDKFRHADLEAISRAKGGAEELRALLARVHPWSTLPYGLTASDCVLRLYLEWIPKYHGREVEIQILAPMTRGSLGTANLNRLVQEAANPPGPGKPQLVVGERVLRQGDRVIHRRNNYELNVFNGDIGRIEAIDNAALSCEVVFSPDGRRVTYRRDDILELDLAYAITIHKSQGSEFPAVIMPVLGQHYRMLHRNLVYTGLTRARRLAVLVGTRRALAMAVAQEDSRQRQTALRELLGLQEKDHVHLY
jgi:exodeoxyribonuclease V alpha subunit